MCCVCVFCRELELSSVSETTEGKGLSLHHPHLICVAALHPFSPSSSPKPPLCHPSLCLSCLSSSSDLLCATSSTIRPCDLWHDWAHSPQQQRTHSWTSLQPRANLCPFVSLIFPVVLDLNPPLPALSQQRNSSAGNKFASETHTPACQGHFRGILLHRNPLKGPWKSPNDLQLQLSQVVSEN